VDFSIALGLAISVTLQYKVNCMLALLKRPSAFLPVAMSSVVLLSILVSILARVHDTDEGIAAHLFQILMPLQVPIIAFFAIKWLPRTRKEALEVLALQCGLAIAPFAIVFALRL
jgi:hypothetical protein